MEETKMVVLAVAIAIVAAAAIFTSLDVFIALKAAKAAIGSKPGYFNTVYKLETDTKFYRAHLVGVVERIGNMMLYIVEIHPRGCSQGACVDCSESRAMRKAVTEERKFYRYAFKEELYD